MKRMTVAQGLVVWAILATLFGVWQSVKVYRLQAQCNPLEKELVGRREVWWATTKYLPAHQMGIFVKLSDGSFAEVQPDGSGLVRR